jgi:hypothetical protein
MLIVHDQQMTPYPFLGQWVKGQGYIDFVGKNGFRSITKELNTWFADCS